jgi:Solute carrier family 12
MVTKPDDLFENKNVEFYEGNIDIFSFSYEKGLMLIMPYFLKRCKQYKKCTLRLFILSLKLTDEDTTEKEQKTSEEIRSFLIRYRLYPTIQIKTIFLTPNDFENFILQEYQLFMIQKRRQELLSQQQKNSSPRKLSS